MGAAAATLLRMEAMGQRGVPRTQKTRGQRARGLEHKQERAWAAAVESNASVDAGAAREIVSSDGAARVGIGQGSMRTTVVQGTAGYVTRMSGGGGVRSSPIPIAVSVVISKLSKKQFATFDFVDHAVFVIDAPRPKS